MSDQYIFPLIPRIPKRKVFISYHHQNDQSWYNTFSNYFSEQLDLFQDNSLERRIDSTDSTYLDRRIREQYIFGTSITIVLCGTETYKRRWVDWEIYSTLEYKHALLGIVLPEHSVNANGYILIPDRLYANVNSGYAEWIHWTPNSSVLINAIERAIAMKDGFQMDNSAIKMQRSMS